MKLYLIVIGAVISFNTISNHEYNDTANNVEDKSEINRGADFKLMCRSKPNRQNHEVKIEDETVVVQPFSKSYLEANQKRRASRTYTKQQLVYLRKKYEFRELNIPLEYNPYYEIENAPLPEFVSGLILANIKHYVNYAGASYCDIDNNGNKECGYCNKLSNDSKIIAINDEGTRIKAIIVQDKKRKEIVLAYAGSDDVGKLLGSLSKEMVDFQWIKQAKVNKYFYRSAEIIQKKVSHHLRHLVRNHPNYTLVITGHSLGGAIATIAPPLIHRDIGLPYTKMRIVTYGQLRVGNSYFAIWYKKRNLDFLRVVNEKDDAANTPTIKDGYFHVGNEVHIKKGEYYDCKTTRVENWHCSLDNTRLDGFVTDHEKVGDLKLSPTQCTGWPFFLKKKFIKVTDHETAPVNGESQSWDKHGKLRTVWSGEVKPAPPKKKS